MKTKLRNKVNLRDALYYHQFDKIAIFNDGTWSSYCGNIIFDEDPVLELSGSSFVNWDIKITRQLIKDYVDEIELFINGYRNLELLEWACDDE